MRVAKRRVEPTMRQNGIRARSKRRAAFSRFDHRQQSCFADRTQPAGAQLHRGPGEPRLGRGLTYIPTRERWLYLAVVLDLFSRRIVGWSVGQAIPEELACRDQNLHKEETERTITL